MHEIRAPDFRNMPGRALTAARDYCMQSDLDRLRYGIRCPRTSPYDRTADANNRYEQRHKPHIDEFPELPCRITWFTDSAIDLLFAPYIDDVFTQGQGVDAVQEEV